MFPLFRTLLISGASRGGLTGAGPPPMNIVAHGDSMTNFGAGNYVEQLIEDIGDPTITSTVRGVNGASWNYAWPSGTPAISLLDDAPTQIDTHIVSGKRNVLFLFAGTNGLNLTLGGHSGATEYADFENYLSARLAAGWQASDIYVLTCLSREASDESKRTAYNAALVSGAATHGYNIVRLDLNTTIGDAGDNNDLRYFSDGTHPTLAGQEVISWIVGAAAFSATPYVYPGTVWDASHKGDNIFLAYNGGRMASPGGVFSYVRGTTGKTTGKLAFEVKVIDLDTSTGSVGNVFFGVMDETSTGGSSMDNLGTPVSAMARSDGYGGLFNGSFSYYGSGVGDWGGPPASLGVHVDIDAKKGWLLVNGVSVMGDPATGASPYFTWTGTKTIYPGVCIQNQRTRVLLITKDLAHAPASTFAAWDDAVVEATTGSPAGSAQTSTWNAADLLFGTTITNSGRDLVGPASSHNAVRTLPTATSGKKYYEAKLINADTGGPAIGVGIAGDAGGFANNTYLGNSPFGGMLFFQNGQTFASGITIANSITIGSTAEGDVTMVAEDLDAGKAWIGRNGVWYNSGDPATGANPAFTFTPGAAPFSLAANIENTTATLRITTTTAYNAPTGYSV